MLNLTDESNEMLESPKNTLNAYQFWDVQAPEEFVISTLFENIEINSEWDDKAFLSFGDNASDFQGNLNSCDTWISLTNKEGQFKSRYKNFVSRSSSVKLVFSSLSTQVNFTIRIRAVRLKGNHFQKPMYQVTTTHAFMFYESL